MPHSTLTEQADPMMPHPRAGQPAQPSDCIDIQQLVTDYYALEPEAADPNQAVHFGTSGHRGSACTGSFNQAHILAIAQAIVEIRRAHQITGCCFIGQDTHALSEPAFMTVLEVLTAHHIPMVIQSNSGFTPTPVISHAILCHNRHSERLADGIILTPSHNPPHEGGIKYNPPHGGPAELQITTAIEQRANALLANGWQGIKRGSIAQARQQGLVIERDAVHPYVVDLINVVDMKAIQQAQLKLAVDPLGGAGIAYWHHIAEYYQLELTVVNDTVDPTFSFMPLDRDGVIRMDCSSPYAMTNVLNLRQQFDLAFGSDPDHDRHGIVTPAGLMDPNHYLAVCIDYLLRYRSQWGTQVAVGKSLVSSALIDRVVTALQRQLVVMPVGFKWFVPGLHQGTLGFAGEESAGASFLRFNGTPWSTDKDGILLCLLAAEINAVTSQDPAHYYQRLTTQWGSTHYQRSQRVVTEVHRKALLQGLGHIGVPDQLVGDPVTTCITTAPGNGMPLGGLKMCSDKGWFAIRPSGTEALCKIYCESLIDSAHCFQIEQAANMMVDSLLEQAELATEQGSRSN